MNKISVVIPVYGQWEFVKKNINSLLELEEKIIKEIIVVDDCSPEPNPLQFENDKVCVVKPQESRFCRDGDYRIEKRIFGHHIINPDGKH